MITTLQKKCSFFKNKNTTLIKVLKKIQKVEVYMLCLLKCSSETLKNLSNFWNTMIHAVFCSFFIFISNPKYLCKLQPWHSLFIQRINKVRNGKKNYMGFPVPKKNGKLWTVLPGYTIKHSPLIYEVIDYYVTC